MMQTVLDIGVDVAKEEVVVACADHSFAVKRLRNRRTDLVLWLKDLPRGSRVGMEATGSYHELLADMAQKRGFAVFVLNPRDTRHYAKAMGKRGKTDRVDAELIARMIAREHNDLHAYLPPTAEQRRLDRFIKRRAKLTAIKAALKQSLKGLPGFGTPLKTLLAKLDALIKKIDVATAKLINASPQRAQANTRLQSIVGVGPVVSAGLVNVLERVPFAKADAFVAHLGLDPRPDDSGQKIGRRRLSKRGPAEMRRLLFNAAMSGAKTRIWKPLYERSRAKGWSTTAALVINRAHRLVDLSLQHDLQRRAPLKVLDMNHRISG